jgi:hypothetical protein
MSKLKPDNYVDLLDIKIVECRTLGSIWVDIDSEGKPFACQVVKEDAEKFVADLKAMKQEAISAFIKMSNIHGNPAIGCGRILTELWKGNPS